MRTVAETAGMGYNDKNDQKEVRNMKTLVTGFEPFGGESVNPSWLAVSRLPDEVPGAQLVKEQLPVVYFKALDILAALVEREKPDVVLMCGQAGGADAMRIERVGVNLCEARIPDNDGLLLQGDPIDPAGPAAYFSTFPYKAMLAAAEQTGVPTRYSYSAGTYLCNHVLYGCLHLAAQKYPQMRAGFIHVPFLPEQVIDKKPGTPSMPLEDIAKVLLACVEAIAQN